MGQTTQQAAPAAGFNNNTRQSWIQGNPLNYTANGIVSQQLPQTGFLSRIILPISINFTTSASGTFTNSTGDPPTPYNFITRVRVYVNSGQEIVNCSGYGLYLTERISSIALDPRNPITSFNSTNTASAIYSIPATYTTSTTYTINFYLYIPIAWEQSLASGLILLQNPNNRVTLEVTFGNATTLISTGAGTITINSVVATPMIEVFQLPASMQNWPNLSYAHFLLEDSNNAITGVGDFIYKPNLGNVYLSMIQAFINNNANMVPANFSLLRLTYQGTQNSYTMQPAQQLIMQRNRYSADLPDGVFVHDFRYGSGLPQVPSTRDAVDTSLLTEFGVITTVASGVTLTNAYMRSINEQLASLV